MNFEPTTILLTVPLHHNGLKYIHILLSAEFWRYCILSGGTQRRTLFRYPNEEIKMFNLSLSRVRIASTTFALPVACLCHCATTASDKQFILIAKKYLLHYQDKHHNLIRYEMSKNLYKNCK